MLRNSLITFIMAILIFHVRSRSQSQSTSSSITRFFHVCNLNYTDNYHDLRIQAVNNCAAKVDYLAWDELTLVDFTKVLINDQCFEKCMHENLNQTTADGRWDAKKVIEFESKSNATEAYLEILFEIVNSCVNAAEEGLKKVGGFEKHLCLYHNVATGCRRYKEGRSRQKLNQLVCKGS